MPAVLDTTTRRRVGLTAPPTTCPEEDCDAPVAWELGVRASHHAPGHGQLRLSDAVPRLVLVCTGCGEPLWVIEDDGELADYLEGLEAPKPAPQVLLYGRRGGRRSSAGLLAWCTSAD